MSEPSTVEFEHRRTFWDVVLGILSVVAGAIALGHVTLASLISVVFLGWSAIIGGVALLVSGIVGWSEPGHRSDVVVGVLLGVLGVGFLRNPGASLLLLTLLAGSLLLVGGVVRISGAFQAGAPRAVLLVNGIATLVLGALVLFRWPVSALWFLGTIIGIQLILDGITTAIVGRLRVVPATAGPAGPGPVPA